MKRIFPVFFIALLCLPFIGKAQTVLSGGDMSGTITKAQSPYRVTGDIRVPKDSTLTIEAGVYLDFDSAKLIRIDGAIQSLGTEINPVIMTCSDSLLGWLGLAFVDNKGQDTSWLYHTKIEYIGIPRSINQSPYFPDVKHSNGHRYVPSAILAWNASPIRMDGCKFRRNWNTTEADSADIEIINSEFYENVTEFGLYPNGYIGTIEQSHFSCISNHYHNNNIGGWGIFNNMEFENPGEIKNCVFENGWFPLNIGSTKTKIDSCTWRDIGCRAIQLGTGAAVIISDCIFDGAYGNCYSGGQIRVVGSSSETVIKNCTFKNSDSFRGAILVEDAPPTFINCKFMNNIQGIIHGDYFGTLNIIGCVFEGNVKSIMGNKPMLVLNSIFANNKMDTVGFKITPSDTAFLRSSSAIHSYGSNLKVYNSIFWNNENYLGEKLNITVESNLSSVDIYNSIFPEGKASIYSPTLDQVFTGTFQNCDSTIPNFIDTANGNFRMAVSCKDFPSGFNKGYTGPISMYYQGKTVNDILSVLNTDMDGNARIYDDTIDIGPYEIQALANRIDITDSLKDQTICEGKDGAFWAEANSIGLFYEWERKLPNEDWKFHNISPKPITISSAQKQDNGIQYRIKWSNTCGVKNTSREATLHVVEPIPLRVSTPKDTIKQNESATITASSGFVSYNWNTGDTTYAITVSGQALGLGSHWFYVNTIDPNGCTAKDSVKITVTDPAGVLSLNQSTIKVYPNPAKETIKLNLTGNFTYRIYSLDGKLVSSGQRNNNEEISISDLATNQLYVVQVQQGTAVFRGRFFRVLGD